MTMLEQDRNGPVRRRSRAWMWWLTAIALGAAGLGAWRVSGHAIETSPKTARAAGAPIPVGIVEASTRRVADIVGASGIVEPFEVVRITTTLPNTPIRVVHVDFGSMVQAGTVLAEHDGALLRSASSAATAQYTRRKADLGRAEARYAKLRSMQNDLGTAVARSGDAGIEQFDSDRARAARRLESVTSIHRQGLLPSSEVDAAQAELDRAVAQLRRAELGRLRSQQEIAREVDVAAAEVDAARSALEVASEELARARSGLDNVRITSPVAGIVMDRDVNAREVPQAHKPILTIGRIDQVLVSAQVAEEQIGNVHVGDPARVTFNALPNEVHQGTISRIKPTSRIDSRTFEVAVLLKNPDLRLKPGLSAFVRIENERTGVMVPSQAIVRPTGSAESAVFIVEEGRARLLPVKVRAASDGWIEIVGGLPPGAQVVAAGHLALRDGDMVRIGSGAPLQEVADKRASTG